MLRRSALVENIPGVQGKASGFGRIARIPALLLVCAGTAGSIAAVTTGSPTRVPLALSASILLVGLIGLLIRRLWMVNLCLVACSGAGALYAAEVGMEVFRLVSNQKEWDLKVQYARSQGRSFDLRTQREFIEASRSEGIPLFPAFPRGQLLQANADGSRNAVLKGNDQRPLLPLGSISEVETVRGNETGTFLVYPSDEHGFHNPRGVWGLSRLEIAAVGDSIVHGESVPSQSNMVATIRSDVAGTLNLGHGGNGPLSALGTILEYLPSRRPKIVLWVFCQDNDINEDLEREKTSALLMSYLEDPPRLQHLERRQSEIDEKLRLYFESQLRTPGPAPGFRLSSWLTVRELSLALLQVRQEYNEDFQLYRRVLAAAQRAVSSWDGTLVFVYMPSLVDMKRTSRSKRIREQVMRICSALSIPVLDLEQRFMAETARHSEYFYPYPGAHFTGHAGKLVLEELSKQRLIQ
jgi:hypothetical protein